MEKIKKTVKALAVIIIVGFGFFHSMDKNSILYKSFCPTSIFEEKQSISTDTVRLDNNRISVYTKRIIDSGIQHLISIL